MDVLWVLNATPQVAGILRAAGWCAEVADNGQAICMLNRCHLGCHGFEKNPGWNGRVSAAEARASA